MLKSGNFFFLNRIFCYINRREETVNFLKLNRGGVFFFSSDLGCIVSFPQTSKEKNVITPILNMKNLYKIIEK